MSGTRSVESLRPRFARDGIFNIRDLGGIALADGASVAPGRVIRADATIDRGGTWRPPAAPTNEQEGP